MKKEIVSLRGQMVEEQLVRRGIADPRVLEVFRKVPRHHFVPEELKPHAYEDYPLAIGFEQTISQPYMVALMTECLVLQPQHKILEIGTGSGYQTAVLAELSGSVYTVERMEALSKQAEERLGILGYRNIFFKYGDGAEGWDIYGPYDRILVSCASRVVPPILLSQLKEEGLLVIPLGNTVSQVLTVVHKHPDALEKREVCGCAFVPLVTQRDFDLHESL